MALFPEVEPHASGMLDVGDGHRLHWESSGNPHGTPAVVLHGGPGSGSSPFFRRLFDPARYLVVQFDQRNCGRSTPHASDPAVDLSTNTTQALVGDCERLRAELGVDRWLVWGGSWGSTLALAYAEAHPASVSEMVLVSVVTTTRAEVEWVTRGLGARFPEAWARFRDAVPPHMRDGDLSAAYATMLRSHDAPTRERAAAAWCAWEDAHVTTGPHPRHDPRYEDPQFRMCFARLVTHYWSNAAFLEDGQLVRDAHRLARIPGVLINGALDAGVSPRIADGLARRWRSAEVVVVDDGGHGLSSRSMVDAVIAATTRFSDAGGVA